MPKKAVTVKINTSRLINLAKALDRSGKVQKVIDLDMARLSDPYAPSDTTALRKSVFMRSDFGSGKIIYEIYGNADGRNTWNDNTSNFQDAPMRGSRWTERMLNDGGMEKIESGARRILQGVLNGR